MFLNGKGILRLKSLFNLFQLPGAFGPYMRGGLKIVYFHFIIFTRGNQHFLPQVLTEYSHQ